MRRALAPPCPARTRSASICSVSGTRRTLARTPHGVLSRSRPRSSHSRARPRACAASRPLAADRWRGRRRRRRGSDRASRSATAFGIESLLGLLVGWSFLASGIVAWSAAAGEPRRRADGRDRARAGSCRSCCASGVASVPLTAGIWLGDLWLLPLAFLLAGFPLVRLETGSTACWSARSLS